MFKKIFITLNLLLTTPIIASDTMPDITEISEIIQVTPDDDGTKHLPEIDYKSQFYKTLLFIGFLLIVCFAIILCFRRFNRKRPFSMNREKNIKILERRAISSQTQIFHIQIGDKQLILSESKVNTQISNTFEWTKKEEPAAPPPPQNT